MLSFLCRYYLQTSSHTGTASKLDLFSIRIKLGCDHVVTDQQMSCITVYRNIGIKIYSKNMYWHKNIAQRFSIKIYFFSVCYGEVIQILHCKFN